MLNDFSILISSDISSAQMKIFSSFITENGGKLIVRKSIPSMFQKNTITALDSSITHIVTDISDKGKLVKQLQCPDINNNIQIVNSNWIIDCIKDKSIPFPNAKYNPINVVMSIPTTENTSTKIENTIPKYSESVNNTNSIPHEITSISQTVVQNVMYTSINNVSSIGKKRGITLTLDTTNESRHKRINSNKDVNSAETTCINHCNDNNISKSTATDSNNDINRKLLVPRLIPSTSTALFIDLELPINKHAVGWQVIGNEVGLVKLHNHIPSRAYTHIIAFDLDSTLITTKSGE